MVNENILTEFFPHAKKVYNSLMDEQSKNIFAMRMLYNLTGDYNYLLDMITLIPEFEYSNTQVFRNLYTKYKNLSDASPSRKLIIYGAGKYGEYVHALFSQLNWYCFCDKDPNKQRSTFCGLSVISPEQLINEHKDDYVVIGTRDFRDEAYKGLIAMGFPTNRILNDDIQFQLDILLDKQYFDDSIMFPQENEVFVDAGCYNCDTSLQFRDWCHDNYERIYAFEPDPSNYLNCKEIIIDSKIEKIELLNAGVWCKKDFLHFNSEGSTASSLLEDGANNVDVVSLDDVLDGHRVTFIKMDVEGAELQALKGARNSIITYRPRLAICIYHKPADILEIPLYLQSLVSDYKFYIRHYSNHEIETVLYAI